MEFRYEGNSKKGGIYKITNILNGRFYIGSAKRFKERWVNHYSSLVRKKHHNKFLQNDFNKYGEKTFLFEIVEIIENSTTEERRLREQFYIDQSFNDIEKKELCFNLLKKTILKDGIWSSNPETTRNKMSEASKKRWNEPGYRDEVSKKMKKGWTKEARENASQRLSGEGNPMYGKVTSEETKALISEASKKMWLNEETKQKIVDGLSDRTKKQWQDEEIKEKMRAAIKKYKNSEIAHEHQKDITKKQWANEEIRTKMIKALNSKENKEKQSETSKKLWENEEYRNKMLSIVSKKWQFINSEGFKITIVNLKKYCKDNNLSYYSMKQLANNKISEYKGYRSNTLLNC